MRGERLVPLVGCGQHGESLGCGSVCRLWWEGPGEVGGARVGAAARELGCMAEMG